jgi:hypothetical protein
MKRPLAIVPRLLPAATVLAACASSAPREERPPLPFHIALVPMTTDDVRADRKAGSEGEPTKMTIQPDAKWIASFSNGLANALQERAFTRVTVLSSEPGTDASGGTATNDASALARDTKLVHEARDAGADLLLRLEVSLQPVIREEKNGTFWVNLPLFALGGPFGWWLPDRAYMVDAEVTGWFYDPRVLSNAPLDAPLRASHSEIASARRRTERIDLDFVQRAQGDVGDYFLSIVCPAGFLAVENDELQKKLVAGIVDQLGPGLARNVLDQGTALERGPAPFYLDVSRSGISRDGKGGLVLNGTALLMPNRDIETLGTWRVEVEGATPIVHSFDAGPAPENDGPYQRYRFEERLGALRAGASVHLSIQAGERTPCVRSYTFRVPTGPSI